MALEQKRTYNRDRNRALGSGRTNEERLAELAAYRLSDEERRRRKREGTAAFRAANPGYAAAVQRRYRRRQKRKRYKREYAKAWRQSNPTYHKDWHAANREAEREQRRVWRAANPEKWAAQKRRHRARQVRPGDVHLPTPATGHELFDLAATIVPVRRPGNLVAFWDEELAYDLRAEAVLAMLEGRDPRQAVEAYRKREQHWALSTAPPTREMTGEWEAA